MKPSRITGIRAARAASTAPQIAACSRPPKAAKNAHRGQPFVAGKPGFNRRNLALDALAVRARAGPDPPRHIAAKQRRGHRGRDGRIADAHLAQDQHIRRHIHRIRPGLHRGQSLGLGHRGALGEISGGAVQVPTRSPTDRPHWHGKAG